MKSSPDTINIKELLEYKKLVQTTNLQKGYQEQTKLFRLLRIYLGKNFSKYVFSGNIVENNMDYAYFQFTDEELKSNGLKIVIAFIYKIFEYEVWLSGCNRKIQNDFHDRFETLDLKYSLTENPSQTDYILKHRLTVNFSYNDIDQLFADINTGTKEFIENIRKLL